MQPVSFFWHDYETFGTDPQRDRACQFAGLRTDADFRPIGRPVIAYCRPADDYLPHPEACLITGITPQMAAEKGLREADFARLIHKQLAQPGTCALGYNTLRFDDEVTRNLFYRNFFDPYGREWQNDNSRWDLIDIARAAYALRPAGIIWPENQDGSASFRLEDLTRANQIEHTGAHDALADVYATIAFARLIRERQPKLYQYLFEHRSKTAVLKLLQCGSYTPLVHVSGRLPVRRHCLAVILPLCRHPTNTNEIIVYDLSTDPTPMLSSSATEIRENLFTANVEMQTGTSRIPLKTVHINKCPVLAPLSAIRAADAERLEINLHACSTNLQSIKADRNIIDKLANVFGGNHPIVGNDPDLMIYSGGFFGHKDKATMERIRMAAPETLANFTADFDDQRLPTMLFRYRARNFPESLSAEELDSWRKFCAERLTKSEFGNHMTLSTFTEKIRTLQEKPDANTAILCQLEAFAASLRQWATNETESFGDANFRLQTDAPENEPLV